MLKVNWEDEDNIMDWTLEIISKAVWCPHAVVQRVMSDKDGMHQSRSNVHLSIRFSLATRGSSNSVIFFFSR